MNNVTLPGSGTYAVTVDWDIVPFPTDEKKINIVGAKKYGTEAAVKTGEETRPKNAAVNFIIKVK